MGLEGKFQEAANLLKIMGRIIVWNVRGLNSQQKQRDLKLVLNSQRVGLVGLLETKVKGFLKWGRFTLVCLKGGVLLLTPPIIKGGELFWHGILRVFM